MESESEGEKWVPAPVAVISTFTFTSHLTEGGALTVTRTRFAGLRVRIPTHGR